MTKTSASLAFPDATCSWRTAYWAAKPVSAPIAQNRVSTCKRPFWARLLGKNLTSAPIASWAAALWSGSHGQRLAAAVSLRPSRSAVVGPFDSPFGRENMGPPLPGADILCDAVEEPV